MKEARMLQRKKWLYVFSSLMVFLLKFLRLFLVICVGLILSTDSWAENGDMQSLSSPNKNYPFFLELWTGYSYSREANLEVDNSFWDRAVQGYNSRLDETPVFELGIGFRFKPWLHASISTAYRGTYHYAKYQNQVPGDPAPYPLGTKTRYFDLDNSNVMFNLFLHSQNKFAFHFRGGMVMAPFIGVGVGAARNKIFNFHSVLEATDPGSNMNIAAAVMPTKETYSLAAQGMIGFLLKISERSRIDFGYRFYYGGKFESNNYFVDDDPDTVAPPWKGRLMSNELFLKLNYSF